MSDTWLEKFKKKVVPKLIKEFEPEKILLFGSRIKGEVSEDSDIDVILVANAFATSHFIRRMPLVLKKIRFNKHIDFICYPPTEFQRIKSTSSVVIDALRHGEYIVA